MGDRKRQTERRKRDEMRKREHREHRERERERGREDSRLSLTPQTQRKSTTYENHSHIHGNNSHSPSVIPGHTAIIIFQLHIDLLLGRHIQQHVPPTARDVRHVPIPRQRLHNRLARLDLPQRQERIPRLLQRPRHRRRSLGLPLRTDHSRLSLLFSLPSPQQHDLREPSALTFSTINLARSASVPASASHI